MSVYVPPRHVSHLVFWVILLTTIPQHDALVNWKGATQFRKFTQVKVFSTSSNNPPEVYPIPRRKIQQRLKEEAKALDPGLVEEGSAVRGTYTSVGWSNRIGTVLTPVALPGVYTADRPFYWNTIDVSCRMTVIKMNNGGLFVHSPVALDASLKAAVDALGVVRHIVSPNYEHVKFAQQWAQAYPEAYMWACPGLAEREPQVKFTHEIPTGIRPSSFPGYSDQTMPDAMWDTQEIQPLHFDCEINPFTGRPFFNEVIFYHVPTRSLIMTDTYWNYPQADGVPNSVYQRFPTKQQDFGTWELAPKVDVPFKSLLWKFGMDQVYRPFYMNLMVGSNQQRKQKFEEIATFILKQFDAQTLIPAHGDIVRGADFIRQILQEHFAVDLNKQQST